MAFGKKKKKKVTTPKPTAAAAVAPKPKPGKQFKCPNCGGDERGQAQNAGITVYRCKGDSTKPGCGLEWDEAEFKKLIG